jgi:uncharacterized phiE125 gp8 family phage protein
MRYSLKTITPPAIEPVTVAELKLHTHIDYSEEDSVLEKWISSARILAEGYQRQVYISRILEMSLDTFPPSAFDIPYFPLIQLISIKYFDLDNTENTLYYEGYNPVTTTEEGGTEPSTNSDFIIDISGNPGRVSLAYAATWPVVTLRPIDAVRIRFAAGYGLEAADVPENVRDAIMLYCAYRNENRAGEISEYPKQFLNLLRFDR